MQEKIFNKFFSLISYININNIIIVILQVSTNADLYVEQIPIWNFICSFVTCVCFMHIYWTCWYFNYYNFLMSRKITFYAKLGPPITTTVRIPLSSIYNLSAINPSVSRSLLLVVTLTLISCLLYPHFYWLTLRPILVEFVEFIELVQFFDEPSALCRCTRIGQDVHWTNSTNSTKVIAICR